jgi:uncharacterized protein (DUF302 family)
MLGDEWRRRMTGAPLFAALALIGALAACAATPPAAAEAPPAPAVSITRSAQDFAATLAALKAAAHRRGFAVIAEIDHAAGAKKAGLDLPPTTLVLFGDPARGTPLIAGARTVGLDLPLRALVTATADGKAEIAVADMRPLFAAHNAPAAAAARLNETLAAIAAEAAR